MLICFDGTWDDPAAKTNVWCFAQAYAKGRTLYLEGVGAGVSLPGHIAGGLFGAGEGSKVDTAMSYLRTYPDDPVLDVVGFSRGSATALDFANRVHGETTRVIRFLGLWDTVAAFGVANLGFYFSKLTWGHHLYLPPDRVLHAYHAMALDEHRPSFVVTRLTGAHEVWFTGVHTDVGGSGAIGLSNITLRWMLAKATAVGLPVTPPLLLVNPAAAPSLDPLERASEFYHRSVGPADHMHYTVTAYPDRPRETVATEVCA